MATHSVTTQTFDKECCKRSLCVSLLPPPLPLLSSDATDFMMVENRSSPRLVHHEILATPHFRFTVWGDSLYLQLLQTVLLPTYALEWRRLVRSPTQLVCFGLIIKFGWPRSPRHSFLNSSHQSVTLPCLLQCRFTSLSPGPICPPTTHCFSQQAVALQDRSRHTPLSCSHGGSRHRHPHLTHLVVP